ncbi:uncharacterized protein Gasu_46600 [Galdieria sulphuraria]|uniref:Uncharacterized protein n=1 Tax=Galdieria sulphuraria TaxID=130081 RepID=M2XW56_GALSU|nr:uncharacterized protein Gasu_46600 [Galdieria sulphuraria]EME27838.1 hypothetical protein Gasu_46600 [Galdieria sulphuraria]|eukprot:XP_005704358.1 hypothetical protein Gasu_46600 [Galdieria sulphuraria]
MWIIIGTVALLHTKCIGNSVLRKQKSSNILVTYRINRIHFQQTIRCSTENQPQGESGKIKTGKLLLPNVSYYLTKNNGNTFPQLPLNGQSTEEILGSTKKILLDHRGVVYTQKSTVNMEKEHIAALETKNIQSKSAKTHSSFGVLTVDSDLHVTPASSLLPQSPITSLCTTKKGVVLGVLQSTDDEDYIPILWMANYGTCGKNTECFLVGISIVDLKRFQAGIVDQLIDLFAAQFQVKAKNLRVLIGMTPSMKFPRASGNQVLEIFDCERWKLTRQFQIVHMVGKKHTEQLVISKKRTSLQKDREVLARKTLGSIQWKVDISRLIAERLQYLGIIVLNNTFPVSLLENKRKYI